MSTTLAAAVLATTVRLLASHAYAEGAPPGFSGGFKEESCHACHFHAELNSSGGRVTIDGAPAMFASRERYTLTVTLTRSGMKRAGFQLAARFKDSGAQAGTLAPAAGDRERVKVERQGGVEYAGQKHAGSSVDAPGAARWTIEWTAPDRGGPVIFHASANAADGNESADGDFVYTAAAASAPLFGQRDAASVSMQFEPESPTEAFIKAAAEYDAIWKTEGARMIAAMERFTGLPFEERAIKAVIYEAASFSGSGSRPMYLRASYPPDVKRATLIHELLHRMLGRVQTTDEIDEHRKLFLVLYEIWVSLYGKEFADQNVVIESGRKGIYDYDTAWKWALAMTAEERAAKFAALRRGK